MRAGLVILCLAWGALATLMVVQHASAAHDVAATDESLSLDAQQIYQSLADADVTVSTAYLYGRTGPYADRVRYQHDIAVAAADLKVATAASGNSSIGASLARCPPPCRSTPATSRTARSTTRWASRPAARSSRWRPRRCT